MTSPIPARGRRATSPHRWLPAEPAPEEGRPEGGGITALLREAGGGNRAAFDRLLPLVYAELKRLAHGRLRLERPGHTLGTTALVHEAYFRLVGQTRTEWQNRGQFFAVASEAMRRILLDYAKRRRAAKRGGAGRTVPLDDAVDVPAGDLLSDDQSDELLALDGALRRLAEFNPRGAQVVQYRFFGGLSVEEIGAITSTSERTVRRAWMVAKAWLRQELAGRLERDATLLNLKVGAAR
jgi:RNA polymerase sigma factor (TIGR02999 family)